MTPRIPMELGSDLPVEEIEEIDEEGNPISPDSEGEDNPVFREQDADTNSSASSS